MFMLPEIKYSYSKKSKTLIIYVLDIGMTKALGEKEYYYLDCFVNVEVIWLEEAKKYMVKANRTVINFIEKEKMTIID